MIQLIKVTDIVFAVRDNYNVAKNQVPVGSLLDAKLYLKDFHGVQESQVTEALDEMRKTDTNTADFGVTRGLFMFTSNQDVTTLLAGLVK